MESSGLTFSLEVKLIISEPLTDEPAVGEVTETAGETVSLIKLILAVPTLEAASASLK